MQTYRPPVDIYETETAFHMVADMPGANADQIAVDMDGDQLRISAEIALEGYDTARWERRFSLNQAVDREQIDADYHDGVLSLTMAKPKEQQPRRIPVRAA